VKLADSRQRRCGATASPSARRGRRTFNIRIRRDVIQAQLEASRPPCFWSPSRRSRCGRRDRNHERVLVSGRSGRAQIGVRVSVGGPRSDPAAVSLSESVMLQPRRKAWPHSLGPWRRSFRRPGLGWVIGGVAERVLIAVLFSFPSAFSSVTNPSSKASLLAPSGSSL